MITFPSWFKKAPEASPNIGEENQFGSTRGLRYGPLRINKTGIFANNGTLDSTVVDSSGFHGYSNAGTENITIDAATGINVVDNAAASVFKTIINGTDVGDVIMGNYTGGAGTKYDKSAGTFDIKGALSAGSISIGTSPNWFKVDTSGNIWLGAATLAAPAPFSVTNAGALTATSGSIAGWDLSSTTISKNNAILDSAGLITVSNGDNKVVINADSGVGYVDFYEGGSRRGRLRGLSLGGIGVVGGDMALDNNESFLIKGTGSDYAAFTVDGSNKTIIESSDDDALYIQDHDGHSLATFGTSNVNLGGSDHQVSLQLHEMGTPGTPSANTVVIYVDSADNVLKAKDDAGNVHSLW